MAKTLTVRFHTPPPEWFPLCGFCTHFKKDVALKQKMCLENLKKSAALYPELVQLLLPPPH